ARIVVSQIYAIALRPGGKSSVQASRRRTLGARLLPRQSEVADEYGFRGIAQIVNLHHAWSAPADGSRNQIRYPGVTLPPILMRVAQAADHHRNAAGLSGIGDIPDFVRAITEVAQHIKLAFAAVRQVVAAAHAHHGRAAELPGAILRLARNVNQVLRML